MTTATQARDGIMLTINTAWLASGVTSGFQMQWDNVKLDPVIEDDDGNPLTFGRSSVRHFTSTQETLGGVGSRKHQTEGQVIVQIFTPGGDGSELADLIVEVLKTALRNVRVGDLWFFDVRVNEIGDDGPHFQTHLVAGFRYSEAS